MLALLIVWVAGGPWAAFAWVENFLRALTEWVQALIR
jgi:hypothetical protein